MIYVFTINLCLVFVGIFSFYANNKLIVTRVYQFKIRIRISEKLIMCVKSLTARAFCNTRHSILIWVSESRLFWRYVHFKYLKCRNND